MTKLPDLSRLPFPVAHPLHFARGDGGDIPASKRSDNAIFAVYQTMRLAALLMLSEYLEIDEIEPALLSRIRGLRAPHWQEWALLADSLARYWADPARAHKARFRSVVEGWVAVSRVSRPGEKTPPLEPQWAPLIEDFHGLGGRAKARSAAEAVWELRNFGAHRMGTATPESLAAQERALAGLLPLTEAIVARVFGAADFVLLRALPRADGPLKIIELAGPHPDLQFVVQDADPDWEETLAETEVAAHFGDKILPVYPFLLYAEALEEKRPAGLIEPVVMIDGVAEGRLTVLGVTGGYTVRGLHLDATQAALKRKHGDLSFDRKDVAPWTILAWARMTAQQTLEDIYNRKYFPSFYLERPDVGSAPQLLEKNPGKALLLIGDAGSGKSSLIARLAERLCGALPDGITAAQPPEERDAVVAYLSGRADFGGSAGSSGEQLLADAVARKLGIREGGERRAFASLKDLVDHLQAASRQDAVAGRPIWLLLDGINEADRFVDLIAALDPFLPTLASAPNLRLVVSMRSGAYYSLAARNEGLGTHSQHVLTNAHYFLAFEDKHRKPQPFLEVRPFLEAEEGPRAYELRQNALPLRAAKFAYRELHPELRRLLLRPLHLHLFHETWAGKSDAPGALDEGGLFDAYLNGLTEQNAGAAAWLERLAQTMLDRRGAFLPVEEADRWVAEWRARNGFANRQTVTKLDPVEELVAASLLLRPAETGSGLERALLGYQFTHQKLAERVLLRHIDAQLPEDNKLPSREMLLRWATQAAEAPDFPELTGAVESWVRRLMLARDPDVAQTLEALLEITEPSVNERLISAVVLSAMNADHAVLKAVLQHLGEVASQGEARREFFLLPASNAAGRLDVSAPLATRKIVWQAVLNFVELYESAFPASPNNSRDLSVSYSHMGDLAQAAGEREQAEGWYRKDLEIAENLAALNPVDVQAQRDLSISYNKMGDLAQAAGQREDAEAWYRKAMEIAENLAALNPADVQAQRDLSISYNKMGDLAQAAGQREDAEAWYRKAMEIRENLAALNPADVQAQRDLSISYNKMGDLAQAAGQREDAEAWYRKAMEIAENLAALNPADVQAQRDLSVSYNKMGDLARAAGQREDAEAWYRKAMEIRENLAALNPVDVEAQRDLSVSYNKMGDLARAAGQREDAEAWYRKAMEIRENLAALNPADVQAQRDLSVSYNKMGDLARAAGQREDAEAWYRKAMEIRENLAALNPADVQAQRDLSVSYNKMGDLAQAVGEREAAEAWYRKAMEIAENLAHLDGKNLDYAEIVAIICIKLALSSATTELGRVVFGAEGRDLLKKARPYLKPFLDAGTLTPRTEQINDHIERLLSL